MAPAEHALVVDAANLAVLLLGIGLIFQLALGKQMPASLSKRYGRVSVAEIDLPELFVALVLVAMFWMQVQATGELAATATESEITLSTDALVLNSVIHIFLLLCVFSFLAFVRKLDVVQFFGLSNLTWRRAGIWIGGVGIVSTLAVLGIAELVSKNVLTNLLGEPRGQDSVIQLQTSKDPAFLIALIFSAVVIAPVWEEAIFRGYLYPVLKRFSQPLLAVLVVSALFAAVHSNAFALFPLLCLAIVLCIAYELTGSLWVPIGIHAVFNALNVTFALMSANSPPAS